MKTQKPFFCRETLANFEHFMIRITYLLLIYYEKLYCIDNFVNIFCSIIESNNQMYYYWSLFILISLEKRQCKIVFVVFTGGFKKFNFLSRLWCSGLYGVKLQSISGKN